MGKLIAPLYLLVFTISKMNTLNKFIAVILLVALLPLPYFYYQILRIVVFSGALIYANKFYKDNQTPKVIIFGIVALIWNPISPIHFDKSLWMILDITGAATFYLVASET